MLGSYKEVWQLTEPAPASAGFWRLGRTPGAFMIGESDQECIPNQGPMEPSRQIALELVMSRGRATGVLRQGAGGQEQGATVGCQRVGANSDPRQPVGSKR